MKIVLKDEILTLRKQGKTYKQIRKELNCTLSVISYHCRRANLSTEVITKKPSDKEIELANKLYKEGLLLKDIAKKVGRHRHTIKKYIHGYEKLRKCKTVSASESVINWRKRTKQKLVEYKGGKCQKCGYDKCIAALEFHHTDPNEKDFTISGKSWSFERMKKEVDKCILLCANCHTEEHNCNAL